MDDESHCPGAVLIEAYGDWHDLHGKVLDMLYENEDLKDYDMTSIKEYTVFYLQLDENSFLSKLEVLWGVFHHLVN